MNQSEDDGYNYYDAVDDDEHNDFDFDLQYADLRNRMNELYESQKSELFHFIDDNNNNNNNENETDNNNEKHYNYYGVNLLLKTDLGKYINDGGYMLGNIFICAYQVNTTGQFPFLQYLMNFKRPDEGSTTNVVSLPRFPYLMQHPNILQTCNLMLDSVLMHGTQSDVPQYNYKGFAQQGNDFFVFFDFSNYNIEHQHMLFQNDFQLVLIDEIVNHKKMCNYNIDKSAVDFFSNNPELLFLTDNNNKYYETPTSVYSGNIGNMVDFTYIFGVSKTTTELLRDPYYYFTDYNNAVGQSCLKKNDYFVEYPKSKQDILCSVIRFAVFLGHMEIKDQTQLAEAMTDSPMNCDSIYISGRSQYWALQKYEQQTSLSTHYVNVRMM